MGWKRARRLPATDKGENDGATPPPRALLPLFFSFLLLPLLLLPLPQINPSLPARLYSLLSSLPNPTPHTFPFLSLFSFRSFFLGRGRGSSSSARSAFHFPPAPLPLPFCGRCRGNEDEGWMASFVRYSLCASWCQGREAKRRRREELVTKFPSAVCRISVRRGSPACQTQLVHFLVVCNKTWLKVGLEERLEALASSSHGSASCSTLFLQFSCTS